jgi:two-component system, OmpR family, sensor histidine kinase TctE
MTPPLEPARRPTSVGGRLLVLLLAPVGALLLAGVLIDYYSSIGPVGTAFDRSLGDVALLVAAYVRPGSAEAMRTELPPEMSAALNSGGGAKRRFALRDRNGTLLAGDPALPVAPAATVAAAPARAGEPVFGDAVIDGEILRVAWYDFDLNGHATRVTVGEPARTRDSPTRALVTATLVVDILQLIAIPLLVIIGVRLALQPLLALRDHMAARSARELEPLDATSVPVEAQTLVDSLNALFGRVRATAESQQKFVADAAHQMRTPLAGIQAQLELLERDPNAASVRERIHAVGEGIRRLAHTAHQLLTLARAESAATLARDFRPVDLAQLIEETVTAQLDRALARGIDLGAEAAPATVTGVGWLLRELLINLVDNALNYTPAGGVVTLRSGVGPTGAFLEVEDDGPGIAATERPLVTARFHRAPGAAGKGTGLGLAIVNDVALVHGASLAIESGAAGRGTRVRIGFTAPRAAPA